MGLLLLCSFARTIRILMQITIIIPLGIFLRFAPVMNFSSWKTSSCCSTWDRPSTILSICALRCVRLYNPYQITFLNGKTLSYPSSLTKSSAYIRTEHTYTHRHTVIYCVMFRNRCLSLNGKREQIKWHWEKFRNVIHWNYLSLSRLSVPLFYFAMVSTGK